MWISIVTGVSFRADLRLVEIVLALADSKGRRGDRRRESADGLRACFDSSRVCVFLFCAEVGDGSTVRGRSRK